MITTPRSRTLTRALASFMTLVVMAAGSAWVLTDTSATAEKKAFDVTGALPASVLLHIDYDGAVGATNCRQLALSELWREPQMEAFMAPIMEQLHGMVGGMTQKMTDQIGISLDDVSTLCASKITMTLVDFTMAEQGPPVVDLLVTLDLAKDKALVGRIQNAVKNVLEGEMQAQIVGIDLGGVQGMQTEIDGINLIWAAMGSDLIIGTQVSTISSVLARMKAQSTVGGLLENQNFVKARTKSAPTGEPVLTVYGDVARALAKGQEMAGPDWDEIAPLISLMGYDSIKDLSYCISFEGRAIVDRVWIGAPKGLSGIYSSFKHSKAPLRTTLMAPKDSFLYYAARINLSEMVNNALAMADQIDGGSAAEEIDGMIAEVDSQLGFSVLNDLLPSIGQEMAVWIGKAPFGGLIPEMVIAIEMKDKAKFEDCIQKARTQLDEQSLVKGFKFMGREVSYLDTGIMMSGSDFGPGFKPCWTMEGDFLMVSLAPQTLKNYLAAQNVQRPSFKDNADVADALAHLRRFNPEAGQDALAYVDIGSVLTMAADTAGPILQSIHMPAEQIGFEVDFNLYPTGDVFRRHLFGFTAATTIANEGMLVEMHSPMGYGTMIGAVGAGMGLAFAVGVDEFFEGSESEWEEAEWDESDWEEVEEVPADEDEGKMEEK